MLFAKTLIVLCSGAAVLAQSAANAANAVASGSRFIGRDTTECPVDSYTMFSMKPNHITGVSSILVYAAQLTNFSPAEKPAKSLAQTLDAFVQKASTFPNFHNTRVLDQTISLNGSLFQFEKEIRDADNEVSNLHLIARDLRDLIPGCIQDRSLKNWILNLVVIENDADNHNVMFKIVRVTMTLSSDSHHTTMIPKQKARLVISEFGVNSESLVKKASTLSKLVTKVVSPRESVDFFSSSKNMEDESVLLWADNGDLSSVFGDDLRDW